MLTPAGEQEALALGDLLRGEPFELVESSPRLRALRTAELAGLKPDVDDDLVEWDYGDFEGLTTDEYPPNLPRLDRLGRAVAGRGDSGRSGREG